MAVLIVGRQRFGPRNTRRRAQRQRLKVFRRYSAIAALDLLRRALFGLVDRLGIGATDGRQHVVDLLDIRHRAGQRRQSARVDVALGATTDLVLFGDDGVAALRRNHAAQPVAKVDLPRQRITHVVPGLGPRLKEALDLFPAHHVAAFAVVGQAHWALAQVFNVFGQRLFALAHFDDLSVEQRPVQQRIRLQRRAIRAAQDLVIDRADVGGFDGVLQHPTNPRRLDVAAHL